MHPTSRPRLLILGCSTRAAAWSAIRTGFFPVCADEFGDADLQQVAEVVPLGSLNDFVRHPTVVAAARIAVSAAPLSFATSPPLNRLCGPYLGTPGASQMLRDLLRGLLAQRKLPFLEEHSNLYSGAMHEVLKKWAGPPDDGTFLQKPVRSGGGRGIRRWTTDASLTPMNEPHYFQRYQSGEPYSAVCIGTPAGAALAGITRQLIGDTISAAPWPFGYCGSVGPVTLPDFAISILLRIADALATDIRLRGLFGIDFVWDGETPWVVEVNPRYTASCEVLELAQRRALLSDHWRACLRDGPPPPQPVPITRRCGSMPQVLGKMIVYARQVVTAPDFSRFLQSRSPWSVPLLADIPQKGSRFEVGQPVCTVFASGETDAECYQKLVRRTRRVRRWLGEA